MHFEDFSLPNDEPDETTTAKDNEDEKETEPVEDTTKATVTTAPKEDDTPDTTAKDTALNEDTIAANTDTVTDGDTEAIDSLICELFPESKDTAVATDSTSPDDTDTSSGDITINNGTETNSGVNTDDKNTSTWLPITAIVIVCIAVAVGGIFLFKKVRG